MISIPAPGRILWNRHTWIAFLDSNRVKAGQVFVHSCQLFVSLLALVLGALCCFAEKKLLRAWLRAEVELKIACKRGGAMLEFLDFFALCWTKSCAYNYRIGGQCISIAGCYNFPCTTCRLGLVKSSIFRSSFWKPGMGSRFFGWTRSLSLRVSYLQRE